MERGEKRRVPIKRWLHMAFLISSRLQFYSSLHTAYPREVSLSIQWHLSREITSPSGVCECECEQFFENLLMFWFLWTLWYPDSLHKKNWWDMVEEVLNFWSDLITHYYKTPIKSTEYKFLNSCHLLAPSKTPWAVDTSDAGNKKATTPSIHTTCNNLELFQLKIAFM